MEDEKVFEVAVCESGRKYRAQISITVDVHSVDNLLHFSLRAFLFTCVVHLVFNVEFEVVDFARKLLEQKLHFPLASLEAANQHQIFSCMQLCQILSELVLANYQLASHWHLECLLDNAGDEN